MAYFMLDDIMELREALQNNDLKKLFDMWNRAYDRLTIGGLMFLGFLIFALKILNIKFGLTSHITVYTLLFMAIFAGVLLTHNIYIFKKASPGAKKVAGGNLEGLCAEAVEQMQASEKDEDNRGGLVR